MVRNQLFALRTQFLFELFTADQPTMRVYCVKTKTPTTLEFVNYKVRSKGLYTEEYIDFLKY